MPTISPQPRIQFFKPDGTPLSGGKLYTYQANTTTLKETYTDAAGLAANTNPIILGVDGSASVWLGYGKYDYVLYDEDDALQYTQTGLGDPLPTDYVLDSIAGANTIVADASDPVVEEYVPFMTCRFIAAANNTGATTININGLGAKTIAKDGSSALASGDIVQGALTTINYDGTRFQLLSEAQGVPAVALSCSGNSATATQATAATSVNGTAQVLGYSLGVGLAHNVASGPQVTATGSGAAMISFHRPGSYGINFGIDADNQLRMGGWSMGLGVAVAIIHSGNIGSQSVNYATSAGNGFSHAATFVDGLNAWVRFTRQNGTYNDVYFGYIDSGTRYLHWA